MFLVRYELHVGAMGHYAPTAAAALRLVQDIDRGGGNIISITRTGDNVMLTREQLDKLAEDETGPGDRRNRSLSEIVRWFLRL